MAKFKCPKCGKIFKRDMRMKLNKSLLFKRGLRSYCTEVGKEVYCKEVKHGR